MAPLENEKHERLCRLIASGETQTDAYLSAWSRHGQTISKASAKVSASRILRRSDVRERLTCLRQEVLNEHKDGEIDLSAAGLRDLMDETTSTLMMTHDAATRAGASHRQLQAIRAALGQHAGRIARLTPKVPSPPREKASLDLTRPLQRLHQCNCDARTIKGV